MVLRLPNGRIRNCGRNAFEHLRKAWLLRSQDPAMAAFRAVAAEEEAATALILALKQKQHPQSDKLNHRAHPHKASIWPLLNAVNNAIASQHAFQVQLHLSRSGPPRFAISMKLRQFPGMPADMPEDFSAIIEEPFNFVVRSDWKGNPEIERFERELHQLAEEKGAGDVRQHIAAEANMRNQLLYANDEGIPQVQLGDGFIPRRAKRVQAILLVTIGILQTPMIQPFAVQGLEAMLNAFERSETSEFDYPDGADIPTTVKVEQTPTGDFDFTVTES